jgi:hypothetical protein
MTFPVAVEYSMNFLVTLALPIKGTYLSVPPVYKNSLEGAHSEDTEEECFVSNSVTLSSVKFQQNYVYISIKVTIHGRYHFMIGSCRKKSLFVARREDGAIYIFFVRSVVKEMNSELKISFFQYFSHLPEILGNVGK